MASKVRPDSDLLNGRIVVDEAYFGGSDRQGTRGCGSAKKEIVVIRTHQGSASAKRLDYYLDEYTSRFSRRTSRSRGLLFYRLLQQAQNS